MPRKEIKTIKLDHKKVEKLTRLAEQCRLHSLDHADPDKQDKWLRMALTWHGLAGRHMRAVLENRETIRNQARNNLARWQLHAKKNMQGM